MGRPGRGAPRIPHKGERSPLPCRCRFWRATLEPASGSRRFAGVAQPGTGRYAGEGSGGRGFGVWGCVAPARQFRSNFPAKMGGTGMFDTATSSQEVERSSKGAGVTLGWAGRGASNDNSLGSSFPRGRPGKPSRVPVHGGLGSGSRRVPAEIDSRKAVSATRGASRTSDGPIQFVERSSRDLGRRRRGAARARPGRRGPLPEDRWRGRVLGPRL